MRCDKCGDSCGDDFKTRTKYLQEKTAGDCLKVILLQSYDLVFVHNFQVYEVLALLTALVKEHIVEEDDLVEKSNIEQKMFRKRSTKPKDKKGK